jgi:solute carrier family 50 protein (sugar transporter)
MAGLHFLLATASARFFVPFLAPVPQPVYQELAREPALQPVVQPAWRSGLQPTLQRSQFPARASPVVATEVLDWLPTLATVITVGFFLSPAPAAIKVWKKEADLDAINFDSVLFIWLNCTCWLVYANLLPLPEAIAVNFGGWLCATAYLIVWFTCAADQRAVVSDKVKAGALLVGTAAATGVVRVDILGYLVTAVNISMFGAPLLEIKSVLKERSSKALPLPTVATGLFCSSMWTVVGLQLGNLPLAAPNGIGAALNLLQMALIAVFPRDGQEAALETAESDTKK